MTHSAGIRVLHVIDQLTGGGAEVSLVEYLTHAATAPDPVHSVIVLNGRPESAAVAGSLSLPAHLGAPGRRPRWSDAGLIRSAMAAFEPDIVHCALVRSTLATARALRGRDIPMLVTLTSVHYDVEDTGGSLKQRLGIPVTHKLHGMALRRDRVWFHAVSEPVAHKAVEMFGLDPARISVVPRGRPDPRKESTADRASVRESLGIPGDAPVLMTVAREHLVKNHLALLEAATSLLDEFPEIRLILVGGRSTGSEALDKALEESPLSGHVLRLGHRDDVADLLRAGDIFVSSSSSEGLPGSIVEALGIGLPVVAFDVDGVRDALGIEYPGLVPFGDHPGFSKRIGEVLSDAELSATMARMGRQRFEERFDIEVYSAHLAEIYGRLAHRTAGRGSDENFVRETPM